MNAAQLGRALRLAVAFAPLYVSTAYANYDCIGPVNAVTVGPSGHVSAGSAGGQSWGFFCTIGSSNNNVTSDACKGILSVLLAAQAQGKQVRLWYNDSYNCAWHASNGGWAYLNTWYWGPEILN